MADKPAVLDSPSFLDSNVICYLFGADSAKADRAGELLAMQPMISVQVLAEVCNVAHRKARLSWPEIEDIIEDRDRAVRGGTPHRRYPGAGPRAGGTYRLHDLRRANSCRRG